MITASLILAAIALPVLAHFGSIAILATRARPARPLPHHRPPVSIVRPACGNHLVWRGSAIDATAAHRTSQQQTFAHRWRTVRPTRAIRTFGVFKWRDNGAPVRPFLRLLSSTKR